MANDGPTQGAPAPEAFRIAANPIHDTRRISDRARHPFGSASVAVAAWSKDAETLVSIDLDEW